MINRKLVHKIRYYSYTKPLPVICRTETFMKNKINSRNLKLTIICVFINLLIGNLALLMFPNLLIVYRIIISIIVSIIYFFSFYKLIQQNDKFPKWKYAIIAILLSLIAMLIACIFTSIGLRLSHDNIIIGALKGIIPVFVFALFFASPFWIPLAIINFICMVFLKNK